MNINLQQLQQIVTTVAKTELLPRFNDVKRQYKTDGSVVTEADHVMQLRLTNALHEAYPEIALLGEEMTASQQQALLDSGQPLWCLDPVDGTSNFAAGMPYFSVSLALIDNGQVTHGLVYDPILDECFVAQKSKGAWLNNQTLLPQNTGLKLKRSLALIDFKRLSNQLATQLVSDMPYGSQRSLGSVALELCWIAAGRAHVYLHGKQHLWDYAAAQLILAESGGKACTLKGKPTSVDSPSLAPQSTVAAVDAQLFDEWRRYLNVPTI